jgi:putative transcriptional regulator
MNSPHPLIPEYVLGTLSADETRELERELEASPELRAELAECRETFGVLATSLPAVKPPADLKKRLLASVAEEKFAPFAIPLAKHFDLAVERVRELIKWALDPATTWTDPPIRFLDFDGGPRVATADVGFIRLDKGLHFPWHRHGGMEINFILEGTIKDFDGRVYGPGEVLIKEPSSEHEFWVGEEIDAFLGVVVDGQIEIIPHPDNKDSE